MTIVHDRFFIWAIIALLGFSGFSCEDKKDVLNLPVFEGPLLSMDSIYTKMSDSARIRVILKAPKQNNFESGDREWPKGLFLEYLDKDGTILSTFKADVVHYSAKDNLYKAEGNVVVTNTETGDELNTEELFWDPTKEEFFTERFVTIEADDELHKGEGLRADQDFSSYKILRPQGTIYLEDI
tara:strand:+ start:227 stop:775 length:549 start_codon:yes stop_codon:yes gene_type:complete